MNCGCAVEPRFYLKEELLLSLPIISLNCHPKEEDYFASSFVTGWPPKWLLQTMCCSRLLGARPQGWMWSESGVKNLMELGGVKSIETLQVFNLSPLLQASKTSWSCSGEEEHPLEALMLPHPSAISSQTGTSRSWWWTPPLITSGVANVLF